MAEWPFLLATDEGVVQAELPARGRRVTFKLDDPADAGFTASGREPAMAGVAEMETDLVVYRDDVCLFRGRFGSGTDDIDDAHVTGCNAVDYRGFFTDCRVVLDDAAVTKEFTAEPAADIAWTLLDEGQDDTIVPGSALGVVRGVDVGSSVVIASQVYEPGVYIGGAVANLGRLAGGFEWDITPDPSDPEVLRFNTWSPQRGTTTDFVASLEEKTVQRWRRAVDASKYGTLVRQSGANEVAPHTATSADIAVRGRVDRVYGDTSLTDAATVQAAAEGQLALAERILPAYTGTLAQGAWNPDRLWLGDTNRCVIQSGRVDENSLLRVIEIAVTIGDDGGEQVEVTWGRPSLNPFPERDLARRVTDLERR